MKPVNALKWSAILAGVCLGCMILFNWLASTDELAKESYQSYAQWSFDSLKVIFGMIIGALTEKFHNHQVQAHKAQAEAVASKPPKKQ
jgi:hypothetical protein